MIKDKLMQQMITDTNARCDANLGGAPLDLSYDYLKAFNARRAEIDATKKAQPSFFFPSPQHAPGAFRGPAAVQRPSPIYDFDRSGDSDEGFFAPVGTFVWRLITLPFRLAWAVFAFFVKFTARLTLCLIVLAIIGALIKAAAQ